MIMPDPILHTKLIVPIYHEGSIPREKLIAEMRAGFDLGVRLILISAPAGSGKSTLASEFVNLSEAAFISSPGASASKFAWLSLDSSDNQGRRFWQCFMESLQVVLPEVGQAEKYLLSLRQAPPLETILSGLLNQLGNRSEKLVLVLDDYHFIVEPSIHAGFSFMLEYMPSNLQFIISTRADPPLPLNRLRVHNQLLEIRAADLFFTASESEMLINGVMQLGLSAGDLAVLEERTEGWPAGIQLTALLLKDERRKSNNAQVDERLKALVLRLSGRQHLIADYLMDEVINRQSQEVQRFLLNSSILDELCASLCDALSEDGDVSSKSQFILEFLDRTNLFLIPLDEEHTWFRYHHLFSDALRSRLEQVKPGSALRLHEKASWWYEQQGQVEKAIRHAFAARDDKRLASLIETHLSTFTGQGRFSMVMDWLDKLPAQLLRDHPRLGIFHAQVLAISGKLSEAEQQIQVVEQTHLHASMSGTTQLTPDLLGKIAAVRATIAILNADPASAKMQAQRAIDLIPHDDPSLSSVMLAYGDAAQMLSDLPLSIHWLQETISQSRQNNDLSTMLMAYAHLAVGLRFQGKLHQVEKVCLEAIEEVNSRLGAGDWPLPTLAMVYQRLGNVRLEWCDFTGAEQAMQKALQIAKDSSYLSAVVNAYGGLSAIRRSQGDFTLAIELIDKAIQSIPRHESALYLGLCQALRAEYWVDAGNLPAARRWAEERELSAGHPIDYVSEGELYTLARLWLAEGRADEAGVIASRLVAYTQANGKIGNTVPYLVLQALAHREAGRLDLAAHSLELALLSGESEGFLCIFLDDGDQLVDLLQRLIRQKSQASDYARLLLSRLRPADVLKQDFLLSTHSQVKLIEPLTDRELAVLRQIATGSSNQEIAQRLVISVGTVKAHVYHITAKLGARSRTEAVVRAKEVGLIP
jgi:LuxR family maltose regulon positive regulatory protein